MPRILQCHREPVPKIGFVYPEEISRDQALEFLATRATAVALGVNGMHPVSREYLPRDTIIALPKEPRQLSEAELEGLLADEQTTMPLEFVTLPQPFMDLLHRTIRPRNGKALRSPDCYRESHLAPGFRYAPLEKRVDTPALTGTVDTATILSNGRPARVGFHFDHHKRPLTYAMVNGGTTPRQTAFVPNFGRATVGYPAPEHLHQSVIEHIDGLQPGGYFGPNQPFEAVAITLLQNEAVWGLRTSEVLHDGLPNRQLGSTAIMLSVDPATRHGLFGPQPWLAGANES